PDHVYDDDGTYPVSLKVTDATGNQDTTSVDVVVKNVAPSIAAEDVTVDSGDVVTVPVSTSDPGNRDALAMTLKVTSPSPAGFPFFQDITVPGGALTVTLGVIPDGARTVNLQLTDKDGGVTNTTFTLTVGDDTGGTVEPDSDIEVEPAPRCDFGVKLD